MVDLKSPYIVNLEFAFETKHFVALALECTVSFMQIAPEESCFSI